jgi:hypothetical protein
LAVFFNTIGDERPFGVRYDPASAEALIARYALTRSRCLIELGWTEFPRSPSKSARSVQRFLSMHAVVHNTFNFQRHLISRSTLRIFRAEAANNWRIAVAAS